MNFRNSSLQGAGTVLSTLSSTLLEGIESLLGHRKTRQNQQAVERIRRAMLRIHGQEGQLENPRLFQRIRNTRDIEGLWYARAELYADLCRRKDEPHALRAMDSLLPMFNGCLPGSLLRTRRPGEMTRLYRIR